MIQAADISSLKKSLCWVMVYRCIISRLISQSIKVFTFSSFQEYQSYDEGVWVWCAADYMAACLHYCISGGAPALIGFGLTIHYLLWYGCGIYTYTCT